MPQDCAKWEHNRIYSNNADYFNAERDAYCKNTPIAERDPTVVCPTFQVPVGTGIGIFGGNGDIVRDNYIYDNWRDGVKLLYVPAAFRGEPDKGIDTSFDDNDHRQPHGRAARRHARPQRQRRLVGRGGRAATASAATSARTAPRRPRTSSPAFPTARARAS